MHSNDRPQACESLCGSCELCRAYLARRAIRISSAAKRRESLRTDPKLAPLPDPRLQAVELPRATSGLLSGIHGPLSTTKRTLRVIMRGGAVVGGIAPGPKPTPDAAPTGVSIPVPSAPESASRASVLAEHRRLRADERLAPERLHVGRKRLEARERALDE